MKTISKIAIIGTGAVGGYYGSLLDRSGADVHYLLHSDYNYVKKHGLNIESPNGNYQLPQINAYRDPSKLPHCDLIIVALKTTTNHLLKKIIPHITHTHSRVLTLQNGLGNDQLLASLVNKQRVFSGLCFLCSNKVGPGHICHLDYGLITLGQYCSSTREAGITNELKEIEALFSKTTIPIKLVPDLYHAQWKKLVWNIPFNGLSVIHNATTNELIENPVQLALVKKIMNEVKTAAAACTQPIDDEFIEKMIHDTKTMKPYKPSMKLDFDRGNSMELEAIYAEPIRRAQSMGVQMPETEKIYHQLKCIKKNPCTNT